MITGSIVMMVTATISRLIVMIRLGMIAGTITVVVISIITGSLTVVMLVITGTRTFILFGLMVSFTIPTMVAISVNTANS